jgi:hypothetical protein
MLRVLFSFTIYFFLFKHSINARITDPYVLSLFDRSTNNMVLRTLTAAPRCLRVLLLPVPARRNVSSLLASLDLGRMNQYSSPDPSLSMHPSKRSPTTQSTWQTHQLWICCCSVLVVEIVVINDRNSFEVKLQPTIIYLELETTPSSRRIFL